MSALKQDEQVAKQAAMQIKHNSDVASGKKKPLDRPTTDITNRVATAKEVVASASPAKKADGPKLTVVPTAPAHNATDRAPHTKRAIIQHKTEDKIAVLEQKLAEAKTNLEAATKATTKTPKDPKSPARIAVFLKKAEAEQELLAARKALGQVKRELESPEDRKVREASSDKAEKKTSAPKKAAINQKIKPGPTPYDKPTWGGYMIRIARAHKDTDSATAAHKANKEGQPTTKPLDFKWMALKGYIILG